LIRTPIKHWYFIVSMSLTEKIKYVYDLPIVQKLWLVSFMGGSLIAWFVIRFVSMKALSSHLGHHLGNRTVCIPTESENIQLAIRMGQLMSMVGNNTPWECKCLSEALCVSWLLNLYRIPSVFYLGAAIVPQDERMMKAHAWIDVGDRTIIGGKQKIKYGVVATFTRIKLS